MASDSTNPYKITNYIQERLKEIFTQLTVRVGPYIPACTSAATCPFSFHFQDHVGGELVGYKNYTKEDAFFWYNLTKQAWPFKAQNLGINVEQFMVNSRPGYVYYSPAADCQEVKEREQYYVSQGVTLGPAWSINNWYTCNHPGSKDLSNAYVFDL